MFSGLRSTKYLERATGHVSPPTESIRGWNSLFLLCSPPCLVFVGLSVNCANSTPLSFLQSWKSSIFIAWCSWRSRRPKNCVKSHQIEEVSASRVLEPNFSASHSTSSSFSIEILALFGRLPIPDWRGAELSRQKLSWKSRTPCLLWWKTCILSHLNVYQVQLSSLLSCLARSRHHFCFLLQRRMFQVACLVFLARFPRFCWQYFSACTTFPIHSTRKTYLLLYLGFWKNFLALQRCFARKTKSLFAENRGYFLPRLISKFPPICCYRNSSNLIGSCWFLLCF